MKTLRGHASPPLPILPEVSFQFLADYKIGPEEKSEVGGTHSPYDYASGSDLF